MSKMRGAPCSQANISRRGALTGAAAVAGAVTLAGLDVSGRASTAQAAAPLRGVMRPHAVRFKLGAFEITNILDGTVKRPGPYPIFGEDQPEADVKAFARANRLPDSEMENGYTVTLLNTGAELILFDTGSGRGGASGTGHLVARLEEAGYHADDIDVVVITHGHPDHIGGLMANGGPQFKNARYVIGRVEYDYWSAGKSIPEARAANQKLFVEKVVPLADKTTFIDAGATVVNGVTAVEAFGHTPGMLAYLIESEGRRLMLWADVTNHYVMSLARPDWHVRFDGDKSAAAETRQKILSMVATDGIPAIGYHMPFPSVGYVEKAEGGFRWVPVTYQLFL